MKKPARLLFLSVLFGAGLFLFKDRILQAVGDYLIIEDELQPVDVIHVIAGEDYRTNYAIELYKRGYAKYLFFTGGLCKKHGWEHGRHGRDLALAQGVPMEAIAYDDSSVTSTYAETVLLKAWMEQRPQSLHSVIVVSDPFHMRRAWWTNRNVLGKGSEILMAPVPFDQIPFKQQWWRDRASQAYVRDEYKKFFYYLLRYQLAWGPAKDWLAAFDQE